MKKIVALATVLFFVSNVFAQSKSFEADITKLMYAKNGMGGVEKITDKLAQGVVEGKKVEFKDELNTIKATFIQNTINTFKNDYTHSQINAIYDEFHSDKIQYTEETIGFFSKFRRLKGEFFRSAKELYISYQR